MGMRCSKITTRLKYNTTERSNLIPMKSNLSNSPKVIPENMERLKTKKNSLVNVNSRSTMPSLFSKPEIL